MKTTDVSSLFGQKPDTFDVFEHLLMALNPDSPCVDLGCGHGKYAIIADKQGLDITGVDGRPDRIPFDYKGVKWVVSDVMDFDVSQFKTVFLFGLLYHMERKNQEILLSRMKTCKTLIINTHFAHIENGKLENEYMKKLLTITPDKSGAIYKESDHLSELKSRTMAALNNTKSFWPTLDTLEAMLNKAGFSDVSLITPYMSENRTFIVARKGR